MPGSLPAMFQVRERAVHLLNKSLLSTYYVPGSHDCVLLDVTQSSGENPLPGPRSQNHVAYVVWKIAVNESACATHLALPRGPNPLPEAARKDAPEEKAFELTPD